MTRYSGEMSSRSLRPRTPRCASVEVCPGAGRRSPTRYHRGHAPTRRPDRSAARTRCGPDHMDAEPDDHRRHRRDLTNGDLARIFHDIGDMLEVKGELVFKTVAYHRAADAIGRSPVDPSPPTARGHPPAIPGVGKAISDKIDELADDRADGLLRQARRRDAARPGRAPAASRASGRRPSASSTASSASRRWRTSARRPRPARSGRSGACPTKTEQLILEGIARLEDAAADAPPPGRGRHRRVIGGRSATRPASSRSSPPARIAGARRRSATSTCWPRPPTGRPLIERFSDAGRRRPRREQGRATRRRSGSLRGPQVDLMIMPPGEAGTYLIHFTGSKEHNVRLRERARDKGWSLSEKGFLRIGEDGQPLTGDDAELRTFATETEAYAFLGLPFIEPELREDAGEIEAALAGRLPELDHRSTTCAATCTATPTGPTASIRSRSWPRPRADAATPTRCSRTTRNRWRSPAASARSGSSSSGRSSRASTPGTRPRRRTAGAARDAAGGLPAAPRLRARDPRRRRARLPHELLATFDLVVASVHVSRRQPRAELTRRTLNAIRSPHVDVIAHPAGRMIGSRDDLDLDWDDGLRGGRADRHGARDERLAAPAGPVGRARAPCGLGRAACCRSTRTPTRSPSSTISIGASARRAARGSSRGTS